MSGNGEGISLVESEKVPGLLKIKLDLRGDERGSFKEAFQQEKLTRLGFPEDFKVVQQNIATNIERGVTRGIHAEPWNKFITITNGEIFVAIVDLRGGKNFGQYDTFEVTPGDAFYVPRGCGNSYQTLKREVAYSYLVDDHWSIDKQYLAVNLADPQLNIRWPIALEDAVVSAKDQGTPNLSDVIPMDFKV